MQVVKSCLSTVFQALRPAAGPRDFLSNILKTSLLATAFDYTFAVSYLRQGQWALDQRLAIEHGLVIPPARPLAGVALPWLVKDTPERTDLGVYFLEFQVEGAPLTDPQSQITRHHGLVRLSKCLGLVGHNIPPLREMVLSIFKAMGNSCPDVQLYGSCLSWVDVVKALKATSSSLDEVFSVIWKDAAAEEDYGLRTILFSGEKSLMEELSLVRAASVRVSVVAVAVEQPASQSEPVTSASQMEEQQTHEASLESATPVIPDDAELLDKSASIIQAFFRRHHRRADASPETTVEKVAKQPVGTQTSDSGKDPTRDENPRKAAKLRSKRLIKEPSSQAYSEQESNFPVSAPDMEPKRTSISMLVQSLRTFVEMPEAIYNELWIEPLLSDRALWL
ncbi:hypothetical protein FRC00_011726 [Tulasnella sp. 408]|nr:hypothetical protein FRC00_011726 [Tulasnella sp. 408]